MAAGWGVFIRVGSKRPARRGQKMCSSSPPSVLPAGHLYFMTVCAEVKVNLTDCLDEVNGAAIGDAHIRQADINIHSICQER